MNNGQSSEDVLKDLTSSEYKYGFTTDVETDIIPKGLNEDVVRLISAKKQEPGWMLQFRLEAYRYWRQQPVPQWGHVKVDPIDYDNISFYAAPRKKAAAGDVDPEILKTFDKLGIPLHERDMLLGKTTGTELSAVETSSTMAVDAIVDSASQKTTYRDKLAELGIIFCSFGEAVREYPDLVRKYLGKVVPVRDNYYSALNSAVFSDGSFVYIPKGVCALPHGTGFLLPHQFQRNGSVRTHPHHRRRGGLRLLSRRMHRTYARREPASRCCRRDLRPRTCRGQVLHGPELVSGR